MTNTTRPTPANLRDAQRVSICTSAMVRRKPRRCGKPNVPFGYCLYVSQTCVIMSHFVHRNDNLYRYGSDISSTYYVHVSDTNFRHDTQSQGSA